MPTATTDVTVTQADVDDMASKLDQFGAVLNDREKAVLLGIFGLAAQAISDEVRGSTSTPAQPSSLPSLSSGFRAAFQKGLGTRFRFGSSQSESTTVKGNVGVDHTKE